jgi:NTE family protein
VGFVRALEKTGIRPDLVCGMSVGPRVGVAYVAGQRDRLEQWPLGMRHVDVVGFKDVSPSGGMLKAAGVSEFLRRNFVDRAIAALRMPLAALAAARHTGAGTGLREGSSVEAVRALIVRVDPLPGSSARAMGAEIVIGVALAVGKLGRLLRSLAQRPAVRRRTGTRA